MQLTWANDFSTQILYGESNLKAIKAAAQLRMSRCGGAIRNSAEIALCLKEAGEELRTLDNNLRIASPDELPAAYGLARSASRAAGISFRMADYAAQYGKSRGSALYTDPHGRKPYAQLPDAFTFALDDGSRPRDWCSRFKRTKTAGAAHGDRCVRSRRRTTFLKMSGAATAKPAMLIERIWI